ncbi:MAG: hypothetical protein J7501_16330 [Bdellovibrio sp.]|nr:hypothetical protein [Bdellovibrio sp.]
MSIIQVLVGFGLASILGLILAEMNSNSNKQMGNVRLQFERAAVVQNLQSIISSPEVCQKMIETTTFGPTVTDAVSGTLQPSVRVKFWLDGNDSAHQKVVIADGTNIPGYSLRVDWIRAFNPTLITTIPRPGTEQVYMATLRVKLSPSAATGTQAKDFIDMRAQDVGRVYFILTNSMPNSGRIVTCYADAVGLTLCPNANDIQVMSGGSWACSTLNKAIGSLCPGGGTQLVQSAGGTASCTPLYKITKQGCEGYGGYSSLSTCNTGICVASTTTQTISIPSASIPSFPAYAGYGGYSGFSGTTFTYGASAPVGSMPGSSGTTVTIPAISKINSIPGFPSFPGANIPGTHATFDVPNFKYKTCDGACAAGSSQSCPNTP